MRGHTRAARRHTRAVAVRANFDRAKIAKPLQLSLESVVGVCLGLVWGVVWGVFGVCLWVGDGAKEARGTPGGYPGETREVQTVTANEQPKPAHTRATRRHTRATS